MVLREVFLVEVTFSGHLRDEQELARMDWRKD